MVPSRVGTGVLNVVMPGWPGAAEEPERRQLLQVDVHHVRFRHELARSAIRSSVTVARRRQLHAEIMHALLTLEADPAEIVHHAEEAGEPEVVADHVLIAARLPPRLKRTGRPSRIIAGPPTSLSGCPRGAGGRVRGTGDGGVPGRSAR